MQKQQICQLANLRLLSTANNMWFSSVNIFLYLINFLHVNWVTLLLFCKYLSVWQHFLHVKTHFHSRKFSLDRKLFLMWRMCRFVITVLPGSAQLLWWKNGKKITSRNISNFFWMFEFNQSYLPNICTWRETLKRQKSQNGDDCKEW
jgi:hypothetical protein